MEQDGNEFDFEICNDGGYVSRMAGSYDNMVWSGSLWGGGGKTWPLIGHYEYIQASDWSL